MPQAELVTIPNIPLIETGVDWPASTGAVTFSATHLSAAAAAPYSDPAVKLPRLRFGHTSAGTSPVESAGQFEEQPCVGKFTNLRVGDEGNTLYADLVGVPRWLADILPVAYPSRSVEAWFDVTSMSTQKHHDMIITSVALLGENLPGVQTLDDLELLFSDDPGPEWIEGLSAKTKVAASQPLGEGGKPMPTRVAASIDTSDVRKAFYEQVAVDDQYWWWMHQMFLDPPIVIAEKDSPGDFALCEYKIEDGDIVFADPVDAHIQWVRDDTGAVAAKAAEASSGTSHAAYEWHAASASRPAERQKEFDNKHSKEAKGSVPINIEALRKLTGNTDLPDDATEEQINEALAAANATPAPDDEVVEETVDEEVAVTASARKKVLEELKLAGMVVVDKSAHEATMADVAELKSDKVAAETKRRQGVVVAAIRERKIPLAAKEHWDGLMEKDPVGTEAFLSAAAKNAVPGPAIGTDEAIGDPESQGNGRKTKSGTGLFPRLEAQRAAGVR